MEESVNTEFAVYENAPVSYAAEPASGGSIKGLTVFADKGIVASIIIAAVRMYLFI